MNYSKYFTNNDILSSIENWLGSIDELPLRVIVALIDFYDEFELLMIPNIFITWNLHVAADYNPKKIYYYTNVELYSDQKIDGLAVNEIIFTDKPQKIIFKYSGNIDDFVKLYNCEISGDQIMLTDKTFPCKSLADEYLLKILVKFSYINKNIISLIKEIKPISLDTNRQYCKINIFVDEVRSHNGQYYDNTLDSKSIVEKWILNNPIHGLISQVEYRQRFFNDTNRVIHNNTFGKYASKYLIASNSNGKTYYSMKI